MNISIGRFTLAIAASLFASCASQQISSKPVPKSEPSAVVLVHEAQKAQGQANFRKIRQLKATYEGKWAAIGPKFQPVLADTRFRGGSVELLDLEQRSIVQKHTGTDGQKIVNRRPRKIRVSYNGAVSRDPEKKSAAALVADAYTLFLLGPAYFDQPGRRETALAMAGETTVDGAPCDQVLAVLRPGFGFSSEDRVLLAIDRRTKQLRRVRMTLNGLDSTQGAEVDVTFRDFQTIGGVLWPTDFYERIRAPFKLAAHHWRLVDLKVNPK